MIDKYDFEFENQNSQAIILANSKYARAKKASIKKSLEDEINQAKIRYKKEKAQKKKKTKINCIIAIASVAIIMGVGKTIADEHTRNEFVTEISEPVKNNTIYTTTINQNGDEPIWYYETTSEIAKETLESNKDVDIDTRIYGTYVNLNDFERDATMDEIMTYLQKLVTEDPLKYTEEEVRACNHATFADYLFDLGVSKEEYLEAMKDITLAYGQNDLDKVQELLNKLTGGTR